MIYLLANVTVVARNTEQDLKGWSNKLSYETVQKYTDVTHATHENASWLNVEKVLYLCHSPALTLDAIDVSKLKRSQNSLCIAQDSI